MTEATGEEAKTIHRMLEYGGDENVFVRDENYPLETDCLIVDEMSMVDVALMRGLLRAVLPGTRLILVGDADQLPSVGAGNVLRDLLQSDVLPSVRLTDIFRQDESSMMKADGKSIIIITHKLNEVLEISDRVAILRKGEYIATVKTAETNQQDLTEMMVGRRVKLEIDRPIMPQGERKLHDEHPDGWHCGKYELRPVPRLQPEN